MRIRHLIALTGVLVALSPAAALAEGINTATGAFSTQAGDLALTGPGVSFDFQRSYNSNAPVNNDTLASPLGPRWQHPYQTSVAVAASGDVLVTATDGQQALFTKNGSDYLAPDGVHSLLTLDSGVYTLETLDGAKTLFDATTGRVTAMTDRYDRGLSFTYTSGRLSTITDEAGREVDLAYTLTGGRYRLTSVTLPDSREVTYSYHADFNGSLASVTDAAGNETEYGYTDDEAERLDLITDANGNEVVANTYDDDGRVIEQLDALGEATTYEWDISDPTAIEVTTTTPNGAVYLDVYDGNLISSSTDPLGNERSYGYDASLNRTSVTDGRGIEVETTYDLYGRKTGSSVASAGVSDAAVYDGAGHVTSRTDGNGDATTYVWDGDDLEEIQHPDGGIVQMAYNADHLVETVTDARGKTATYGYDADFNRISTTTAEGRVSSFTYDGSGRLLTATDPNGGVVSYAYDENNHIVSMTDQLDRETTYEYDAVGNLISTTNPASGTTTTTYDDLNRPVSTTDADGSTATTEYDEMGNVVATTTPTGDRTTFTYDLAGQLVEKVTARGNEPGATPADFTWTYEYDEVGNQVSVTDPEGGETTTAFNHLSLPTTITDPLGKTSTMAYDDEGRVVSTTDPNGNETTTVYDEMGRVLVVTSPEGRTTTKDYDAAGNLLSITDGLGNKASFTYDDDGLLASSVDPRGNKPGADPDDFRTTYTLDDGGQVTEVEDPLGNSVSSTFDEAGNALTVTDPNGNTTGYAYDDLDRLTQITAPSSEVTSFTYDAVGNQLTRTDANSNTTTFDYDASHRQISQELPTGEETTSAYDAEGHLITTITGRGNASLTPADGTISRSYDALGRLTEVDYGDATPDVSFDYDANGRLIQMDDGPGTETYAYDDGGRLTGIVRGSDNLGYTYDDDGLITSRTQPGSVTISSSFDDAGRLESITAGGVTTNYSYDAAGNLTETTLPSGTGYSTSRTYDAVGRLTELENTNGTALSSFSRSFDAAGNPTRIDTTRGGVTTSEAFDYDGRNRLTDWCLAATSCASPSDYVSFTYDAVGNRTQQTRVGVSAPGATTYAYDDSNRMTSSTIGGVVTSYGYDADGNQTSAGASAMTYDLANQMTSIDDGTTATSFLYDGQGKRLRATTAGDQVRYLWDPSYADAELVLERDGANGLIRRHTPGAGGAPLAMNDGSATSYYLPDLMGSTADLISASGAPQARYSYEPFGATTETPLVGTPPANPMRYTGEYADPSGLYHLRARQYDTATGRFTGTDPVDDNLGGSLYAYVNNRPGVFTDPSGMVPFGGAFSAAGEIGIGFGETVMNSGASAASWAWENRNRSGLAIARDAAGGAMDTFNAMRHACDGIYDTLGGGLDGTLACISQQGRAPERVVEQGAALVGAGCYRELGNAAGHVAVALVPGAGGAMVAARGATLLTRGADAVRGMMSARRTKAYSDFIADGRVNIHTLVPRGTSRLTTGTRNVGRTNGLDAWTGDERMTILSSSIPLDQFMALRGQSIGYNGVRVGGRGRDFELDARGESWRGGIGPPIRLNSQAAVNLFNQNMVRGAAYPRRPVPFTPNYKMKFEKEGRNYEPAVDPYDPGVIVPSGY